MDGLPDGMRLATLSSASLPCFTTGSAHAETAACGALCGTLTFPVQASMHAQQNPPALPEASHHGNYPSAHTALQARTLASSALPKSILRHLQGSDFCTGCWAKKEQQHHLPCQKGSSRRIQAQCSVQAAGQDRRSDKPCPAGEHRQRQQAQRRGHGISSRPSQM